MTEERLMLVVRLRKEGRTYREIGVRIGVSACRSRQLYNKSLHILNAEVAPDLYCWDNLTSPERVGLTTRALNCLRGAGILTKEEAAQRILSGKLGPGRGAYFYGQKTHAEVCKWAGVTP